MFSGQDIAKGALAKNFPRIVLGYFKPGTGVTTSYSARVFLLNLSKNVNILCQVGLVPDDVNLDTTNQVQAGTFQITPITRGSGNEQDLFGQPIFTSPFFTAALNLPTGWEFSTSAPKAAIDVSVTAGSFPTGTAGQLVLDVVAEYIGSWWDPVAVAQLLNKIVINPASTPQLRSGST